MSRDLLREEMGWIRIDLVKSKGGKDEDRKRNACERTGGVSAI